MVWLKPVAVCSFSVPPLDLLCPNSSWQNEDSELGSGVLQEVGDLVKLESWSQSCVQIPNAPPHLGKCEPASFPAK